MSAVVSQGAVADGHLSTVLQAGVLAPIVSHLQSKGAQPCSSVTLEELVGVLGLPAKAVGGIPTGSVGVAPAANPLQGTGAAPKSKSRSKKPLPPCPNLAPPPGGCVYKITRGDNQGKQCGKTVVTGYLHCRQCLGKVKPKARYQVGGDLHNGAGGVPTGVVTPSYPGAAMPTAVPSVQPPPQGQSVEVEASPHPTDPNKVVLIPHGYVVQDFGNDTVVAFSMLVNGQERPMTAVEMQEAKAMGLQIDPQAQQAVSAGPVPTMPQAGVPHAGVPQAMPQAGLPQAGVPQAMSHAGIPQAMPQAGLPQAGLPQPGVPQAMPQAGLPQAGLPQPGVPQAMPQAGLPQAGVPQAGVPQAGIPQAGVPQAMPQAGLPQAGVPQAMPQAGVPQAGVPQAGVPQAGVPQAMPQVAQSTPQAEVAPTQVTEPAPQPQAGLAPVQTAPVQTAPTVPDNGGAVIASMPPLQQ